MTRREYDPLSVIPSASILRQRLTELDAKRSKLLILLDTAERIERVADSSAVRRDREEVQNG